MDSIRNLERINQSSVKKYVILTKLNLAFLFSSGLVYWENDKLAIDTSREKFEVFIFAMKDLLHYIQNLYILDEKSLSDEENKFLANLEVQVQENISKMIGIIM